MAGKPERRYAKLHLQAPIDAKADAVLRELGTLCPEMRSTSQLVETVVLWERGIYLEGPAERYLRRLQKIRAQRYLALPSLEKPPQLRRLHLTIDREACGFVTFMLGKYPLLAAGRGELLSLMLHYAGTFLRSRRAQHLRRRLLQVRENYPPVP